jgi:plastocyanin
MRLPVMKIAGRRPRGLSLALAAAVLLPAAAGDGPDAPVPAAAEAATGRLSGTVTVGAELSRRRVRFHLYPDFVRTADEARPPRPQDETGNVVIYLQPARDGAAPPIPAPPIPAPPHPAAAVMRQEGLAFQPHLLAVLKGSTVEFPNADPVFHNVFSLSRAASFDLGRYPRGSSRSVRFDSAGVVKVFCHIHSDMSAVILVLDTPLFARPGGDGRYRIDGIPPGEYTAVAWHERARPLSRRLRIEPATHAVLDFSIPLTEPPAGG